jgi:hypothetical protein
MIYIIYQAYEGMYIKEKKEEDANKYIEKMKKLQEDKANKLRILKIIKGDNITNDFF